ERGLANWVSVSPRHAPTQLGLGCVRFMPCIVASKLDTCWRSLDAIYRQRRRLATRVVVQGKFMISRLSEGRGFTEYPWIECYVLSIGLIFVSDIIDEVKTGGTIFCKMHVHIISSATQLDVYECDTGLQMELGLELPSLPARKPHLPPRKFAEVPGDGSRRDV